MNAILAGGAMLIALTALLRWTGVLSTASERSMRRSSPKRQAEVLPQRISGAPGRAQGDAQQPIIRREFNTTTLVNAFPPRLEHPNKKTVYRIACQADSTHNGTLVFSRWGEMRLPEKIPAGAGTAWEARPDIFGYEQPAAGEAIEWYLNFADADLFFGYGSGLFAQDEIQTAEHPALGSLREAMLAEKIEFYTVSGGRPTPVLITGVERRCAISLREIYGSQFATATRETLEKAARPIRPPTISSILAMAAPRGGSGGSCEYSAEEIEYILATAYTGFRAAKLESLRLDGSSQHLPAVVIHTGFWGCGAFGGNRKLMAMLQLLAAKLANVERLVFHTFDKSGTQHFEGAREELLRITSRDPVPSVADTIQAIRSLHLRWGISDGN